MLRTCVSLCAATLLLTSVASSAATITGSVKDPSGAGIACAVLVSTVPVVGAPRSVQTDATGVFRVDGLAPGHYLIHVARAGFEVFEVNVTVEEGKDAAVDIRLKVAEVKQQIEVAGGRRGNVDSVYRSLRDSGLGDVLTVENLVLHRDNGTITLKSGTLALTVPVMGHDTEAVFTGDGEFTFQPVLAVERDHLKILTGEESVRESFDRALFCFTDNAGQEIRAQAKTHASDAKLADVLHEFRHHLRSRSETPRSQLEYMLTSETMDNVDADILADLYNPAQPGFFSAYLHGRKHSDLRFMVKPRGVMPDLSPEEVGVINLDPQAEQEGIWYLSHLKREFEQGKASSDEDNRVVRANRYRIETVIAKNDHFTATVRDPRPRGDERRPRHQIRLAPQSPRDARLQWRTRRRLYAGRSPAGWELLRDHAATPGARERAGTHRGVFGRQGSLQSRRRQLRCRRARELVSQPQHVSRSRAVQPGIQGPKEYTLVSVGKLVKEWKEQGFACTEWNSDTPMAVAGFNYGDFKKKQVNDAQTGIQVEGYAAQEVPGYLKGAEGMGAMGTMTPTRLLDGALVEAQNAERVFNSWFGKSEFPRIAITQQPQFNFGQSWPTLVYLPMSAFLDSTQRWQLMGHISSRLTEFIDEVTAHEVSHQWWGHEVGWSSYHDQWLSEGFAFFSAGLYLQLTEKDQTKYLNYWQRAREALTQKNGYGKRTNDAGPVWMGLRLSSERNPGAYNSVVYRKGGYVLHMLRSLMFDQKEGDKPFIEMMKDFVTTYRNRSASTEDFQRIAEKHIQRQMNVMGDGKLNWFFSEWVYGTAIPKYKFDYTVTAESDGTWILHANLTQSEVPDNYVMLVPLYVDFDGQMRRLGQARITGSTIMSDMKVKLPAKPRKVSINAFHDVLEQ